MLVAAALALAALARTAHCAGGIPELLRHNYWDEGSEFKSVPLGPLTEGSPITHAFRSSRRCELGR